LEKLQPLKSWWSLIPLLLQISLALVSCAAPRYTLYTVDFALRSQIPESKSCAQCPTGEFCGDMTNQQSIICVSTACLALGNPGTSLLRWHSMIRLPWQKSGPFVEHYESYQPDNGAWHYFRVLWQFTWCIHHGLLLMLSVHTLIRMRQVPKAEMDERFPFNGGTSRRIFIACGLSASRLVLVFNVSSIKYHFLYCAATSMLWISVLKLSQSDDRRIWSQHHCDA
jgi:hypothetical protein